MKVLLVEDESAYALEVEMLLDEMEYELIGIVDNGQEALTLIETKHPDVILMDIEIKGELSGIDVAEKIMHLQIPTIFITSYNDLETYNKAFKTRPYAYIVKPFDKLTLQSSLQIVFNRVYNQSEAESWKGDVITSNGIFLKINRVLKKVNFSDILWLHADGNYVDIKTRKKKFVAKISLTKIQQKLSVLALIRVHKSYIVNSGEIEHIDNASNELLIKDKIIPIGRKYKSDLMNRISTL